jgi:hypothetical protein
LKYCELHRVYIVAPQIRSFWVHFNSFFENFYKTVESFDLFIGVENEVYYEIDILLPKIGPAILEILVDYASTLFCSCNAVHGLYSLATLARGIKIAPSGTGTYPPGILLRCSEGSVTTLW